jgi:hypothetical protein
VGVSCARYGIRGIWQQGGGGSLGRTSESCVASFGNCPTACGAQRDAGLRAHEYDAAGCGVQLVGGSARTRTQIAFGSALHAGVEGMHAQFIACVLDDSSAVILVRWGLQTAWLFRHAGHKRVVHTRLW